jgi:probable phosphomutase (TIGR03848 family)
MTRVLLIRHGATDTLGKWMAGRTPGVHLNEEGRQQAVQLSARLAAVPVRAIYSSPLDRVRETAAPLAELKRVDIVARERLNEVHFGSWTGAQLHDLDAQPVWRRYNSFRSGTRPPGGELMLETQSRVVAEIEELQRVHANDTIAIFSHGDVLRAALLFYLGMPIDLFHRIEISPASVSVINFYEDAVQVLRMNDTGPLG